MTIPIEKLKAMLAGLRAWHADYLRWANSPHRLVSPARRVWMWGGWVSLPRHEWSRQSREKSNG